MEVNKRMGGRRSRLRRLGVKRSPALREFTLDIEALERFVRREPLYRVYECVRKRRGKQRATKSCHAIRAVDRSARRRRSSRHPP